ncbi:MAG: hypothetical protein J0I14_01190 [Propionibacteriaceae bacterium]|jgi:hypothetical protein|nr:hypothetical protein [Propionibacteriaceae bacterium]
MIINDSPVEVARLFSLLGQEPAAVRRLSDTTKLQEIQDAKLRLAAMNGPALRAGLRRRARSL